MFFFTLKTETEIIKYVNECKQYNSFYEGNMTNYIYLNTINNIVCPIRYIFNYLWFIFILIPKMYCCCLKMAINNRVEITDLFRCS